MKKAGAFIFVVFCIMMLVSPSGVSAAGKASVSRPVIKTVSYYSSGIKLKWKESKKAQKTYIYRKKSTEDKYKRIATTKKNYYTDKSADSEQEYIYKIMSYAKIKGKKVYSKKSEPVTALNCLPGSVTGLEGTHGGKEYSISLSWSSVPEAELYQLFRSEEKDGEYVKIADTQEAMFEDASVENDTYYYYKVRAVNTVQDKSYYGSMTSAKKIGSYGKINFFKSSGNVYALSSVKVRAGASGASKAVGTAKKGYGMALVAESDGAFSKVIFRGKERYVSTRFLTKEKFTVKSSKTGRIIISPDQENWSLVVVNKSRQMPSGYKPQLEEIFNTGAMLDKRVVPYYEAMYKAAKKDGLTLRPRSAFRSYSHQKRNYNNLVNDYIDAGLTNAAAKKKAATSILPPGTSEHNLGLAVDINSIKGIFGKSAEFRWLKKNAHKYGFILRYTKEKQSITGIISEPWHWRFVGVEYAKDIRDSGLCLEEYLQKKGIDF